MSGKLKIVRVLANPKKKTRSAKVKRRKKARQRAVRSTSGKWVLRRAGAAGATWWNGHSWTTTRTAAYRYPSSATAARALTQARRKAGSGWTVLDVLPA